MPNLAETAVRTYIRAWSERDPAVRAALIEECFAADGRFVTRALAAGEYLVSVTARDGRTVVPPIAAGRVRSGAGDTVLRI